MTAPRPPALARLAGLMCLLAPLLCQPTFAADNALPKPRVQMIYFGGNDCPPCVQWRGLELPKLQQSEVFQSIEFIYVTKSIKSPIPAAMFLPDAVKPYKAKLDVAGGGNGGSSQTAVMVDGEVFDYYFGARPAEDIEKRLRAIQVGKRYPFKRCLQIQAATRQCANAVEPERRIAASS